MCLIAYYMVKVHMHSYIKEMMVQFDYIQGTLWPKHLDLRRMKDQSCMQTRGSRFSW